jgi:predicted methyltransferase MtxX (methanogen marker protein 4)
MDHILPYRDGMEFGSMMFVTAFNNSRAEDAPCAMEQIAIGDLRKQDRIIIHTANNTYRFAVVDPTTRQGVLAGGRLGDAPRRAVLVISLLEGDGLVTEMTELKVGARAIFYLIAVDRMERLVTSPIVNLTLVRSNGSNLSVA